MTEGCNSRGQGTEVRGEEAEDQTSEECVMSRREPADDCFGTGILESSAV